MHTPKLFIAKMTHVLPIGTGVHRHSVSLVSLVRLWPDGWVVCVRYCHPELHKLCMAKSYLSASVVRVSILRCPLLAQRVIIASAGMYNLY